MKTVKSLRKDTRPSFQFYPDDWLSSPDLNACSLEAQGLWVKILCMMFLSPKRGVLLLSSGKQIDSKILARLTGEPEEKIKQLLAELEQAGVFSRLEDGAIYNRRMYREALIIEQRRQAGRLGGIKKKKLSKSVAKSEENFTKKYTDTQSTEEANGKQNSNSGEISKDIDGQGVNGFNNCDFIKQKRSKEEAKVKQIAEEEVEEEVENNIYNSIKIRKEIFNYWNSKKIIVHKNFQKFEPHINSALKIYTPEEIKKAIDNYDMVLKSDKYYWTYKWTLDQFLARKNGIDRFIPDTFEETDYLAKQNGKEKPNEEQVPFEKRRIF